MMMVMRVVMMMMTIMCLLCVDLFVMRAWLLLSSD